MDGAWKQRGLHIERVVKAVKEDLVIGNDDATALIIVTPRAVFSNTISIDTNHNNIIEMPPIRWIVAAV